MMKFLLDTAKHHLQEKLLEACNWFGEPALKEHLQSVLAQNPYFKGFD